MRAARIQHIGILLLLVMGLTACNRGVVTEDVAQADPMAVDQGASESEDALEGGQPSDVGAEAEAEQPAAGEGETGGQVEVKQPRDELAATDPASVVLASGQPQIVEFFAFW